MAGRRVVMFGAGASHGARCPRPPLGIELHNYVGRYLDSPLKDRFELAKILGDMNWTVAKESQDKLLGELAGARSFERLVIDLLNRGEKGREPLAKLNLLMAHALTPPIAGNPRVDDAFVEKPDLYDNFLASRFPSIDSLKNVSFITLNYDCLLERAICRTFYGDTPLAGEGQCLCAHVTYCLQEGTAGIEVLKPHGSINWVPDTGFRRLDPKKPIPTDRLRSDGTWEYKKIRAVRSPIGDPNGDIIVAHYGPGKNAQANPQTLADVRKNALKRTEDAKEIEIIGMHLPSVSGDDPFLDDAVNVMKEKRARNGECVVCYVNPNRAETGRARSYGFQVIEADFEHYVKSGKP